MNYSITQAIYDLYPQVSYSIEDTYYDKDNNIVNYNLDLVTDYAKKQDCKKTASALLYETDWTTIPDVASPANTPYLTNQQEFIAYRNVIRGYAVNPVADPVWPTAPTEQWSST
jgi:hypothetical protein